MKNPDAAVAPPPNLALVTPETHSTCKSEEDAPYRCDGSGTCPSCRGTGARFVREVSPGGERRAIAPCDYCAGTSRCPDCSRNLW